MNIEGLAAYLVAQATPRLQTDLDAIGWAAASAIAAEAPVRTGRLARSVRYDATAPLQGTISMVGYGLPIQAGHIVAYWGTTRYPARRKRYKTGGHVDPNPFISRGIADARPVLQLLPQDAVQIVTAALRARLAELDKG